MKTSDNSQTQAAGEAAPLHTPTPWHVIASAGGTVAIQIGRSPAYDPKPIALVPPVMLGSGPNQAVHWGETKANAALIVKALNAYASDQRKIKALTEALKRTADRLERVLRVQSAGLHPEEIEARISTHPDLCHARKALAKEGQS